jgi:hypothetical protein
VWPSVRRGQSLRRALQVNASVIRAVEMTFDFDHMTHSPIHLGSLVALYVALFVAAGVGQWFRHRAAASRKQVGTLLVASSGIAIVLLIQSIPKSGLWELELPNWQLQALPVVMAIAFFITLRGMGRRLGGQLSR